MDCEMYIGTKNDFFFKVRDYSWRPKYPNQFEEKQTQTFPILVLAVEDSRLAGYVLTGNRRTFLITDGNVAWLYEAGKILRPPDFESLFFGLIVIAITFILPSIPMDLLRLLEFTSRSLCAAPPAITMTSYHGFFP